MVNKHITYAYIETSSYCNLECSFCNRDEVVKTPTNMTVEDYKVILSKLKGHPISEIKLMGMGEPFMHPKFHEICRLTREAFPNAFIISSTNCQIRLTSGIKKALPFIDLLYISIDGYKDNYEKFRFPAKWDKLKKFLFDLKKVENKNRTAINFTVNPENVYDIPKMEELLERFDIPELRLNIVQDWSENKSVEKTINGFSKNQIDFLKTYQHLIKGKKNWDFSECFWVKNGIYITALGEMKVCCMNTSAKAIGNVVTSLSVSELQRSKPFIAIKSGCESNTPTGHCKNCSYFELNEILSQLI